MAIARQMARFLIREAKYRPIMGKLLSIGRHTVPLTLKEFRELMLDEGMPVDPGIEPSFDKTTRNGAERGYISDVYFFRALGAEMVLALDQSDYEGAEIIHNLDTPIPPQLENSFDFVVNGSVLDNVFDPVSAMRNISRMLKPHGRVAHFEAASNWTNNAYLQFSPNWFFDYYVVNRFADCKAYLAFFSDVYAGWELYACLYDGRTEPKRLRSSRFAMTICIAEKAEDSTWDRCPIQGQYRSVSDVELYLDSLRRIGSSDRPLVTGKKHLPELPRLTREFISSYVPLLIFARPYRGYRPLGRLG